MIISNFVMRILLNDNKDNKKDLSVSDPQLSVFVGVDIKRYNDNL